MDVRRCLPRSVKNACRFLYDSAFQINRRLQAARWFRRIMTSNYASGKLALGEKNRYGIRSEWVTVDLEGADVNLDFRQKSPLPFPDNSQFIIYSSHLIEHLEEPTALHLFRECYRVLRKGGYLKIEVPDMEKVVQAYQRNDRSVLDPLCEAFRNSLVVNRGLPEIYAEDHIALLGIASNYVADAAQVPVLANKEEVDAKLASLSLEEFGRWCVSLQSPTQRLSCGHVSPIYFEKLRAMLARTGFEAIARLKNGETNIPCLILKGLERPHRAFFSLYVEARK
jgi:SAM-dependent methyltransferase